MNSDRIKEIHEQTAVPYSQSVRAALLQVWNECQQESDKEIDRLTKDRDEWRAESLRLNASSFDDIVLIEQLKAECDQRGLIEAEKYRAEKAEAEVKRLREALTVVSLSYCDDCVADYRECCCDKCRPIEVLKK